MATQDTERLDACPACGSRDRTCVFAQPDEFLGELRLEKCGRCEVVFLNPRLRTSSSALLEDESSVYDMAADDREREIAVWMDGIRYTAGLAGKTGGRMLDVGCNRGLLMEAARRVGWRVTGVDIAADAIEKARRDYGLDVHHGTMGDGLALGEFDFVTCWHVLEHVADIGATLASIRAVLAPGGALAVQVPSYDMINGFWSRGTPSVILCAVHNYYFTERTLERTMRAHGFRPIAVINNADDLMLTIVSVRERNPVRRAVRRWRWRLWGV